MTAGPVNRALLESGFQNPGEIYDDSKTEFCFDVIADQIDDNWTPLSNILSASGSTFVGSPTIVGVTGAVVYDQLLSLKAQIDAIVSASIPPGSINTTMLQDGSVTLPKLDASVISYFLGFNPITGTYTGNGTSTRSIALPFTPIGVIVSQVSTAGSTLDYNTSGVAVTGSASSLNNVFSCATNALSIGQSTGNVSGRVYNYIAFR